QEGENVSLCVVFKREGMSLYVLFSRGRECLSMRCFQERGNVSLCVVFKRERMSLYALFSRERECLSMRCFQERENVSLCVVFKREGMSLYVLFLRERMSLCALFLRKCPSLAQYGLGQGKKHWLKDTRILVAVSSSNETWP